MAQISFTTDFVTFGWSRFTSRLQQNPVDEGFVKGLLQPMNDLQDVFNDIISHRMIDYAVGYQLDLIGSIVGQSRIVGNAAVVYYFGYTGETGASAYGAAPYRRENQVQTTSITLTDTDYAALIKLKIALNNGHGTIPEIIAACKAAFNTSTVSLIDKGDGSFAVVISQNIGIGSQLYDVALAYVMRPAGVSITITFGLEYLVDENGTPYTDENGNNLYA